jgi:hypothetical protein
MGTVRNQSNPLVSRRPDRLKKLGWTVMINLCKIATSRGLHRNEREEVNWRLAVDSSLPLVRARLRPAITLQSLDG